MANRFFSRASFDFLRKLDANNNRDWFNRHKQEYEDAVRSPALDFIDAMADGIYALSPHFLAVPRKVGGSLMRVYRDVRFGKDKRPFKTNVGIQFRHFQGKDVHAPGFYVHLEPKGCFLGVGIWHPDAPALGNIRTAIAENSAAWLKEARTAYDWAKANTRKGDEKKVARPRMLAALCLYRYTKEEAHRILDGIQVSDAN